MHAYINTCVIRPSHCLATKNVRKLLYLLLFLFVLGVAGILRVGGSLAAPQMHSVGEPPNFLSPEVVAIQGAEGTQIAGWFAAGEDGKPGILLLHGVRSDRREMVGRAGFLLEAGYSVLLIDMQAHGETPGRNITFGFRESYDVHAAMSFLKARVNGRKVGVIGVSLGGAASLLGESPVEADAVILEAVYSSIENAVKNRITLQLGSVGQYVTPLLTWQIQPRLGIALEALSPLSAIGRLNAPVMIIAGAEDQLTQREESRRLFEEAGEPKQLWLIQGAKHQNLHAFAGEEYEKRVLQFFLRHLASA